MTLEIQKVDDVEGDLPDMPNYGKKVFTNRTPEPFNL